jgi:hypothetical protein
LILSKIPVLHEQVDLTFNFSSVRAAPGTTAEFVLPKGVALVEGNLSWSGDLLPDEMRTMFVTIEFVEEGNWTIEAKARYELENGDVWGDAAYLYLFVSETVSHSGFSTQQPQESSVEDAPIPASEPNAPIE